MTERFDAISLTYPQFRSEHYPIPVAETTDQLSEIIDIRVKRGLDVMFAELDAPSDVEYAGYALTTFLHPQQRLDFQYPEAAQALKLALVGAGAAVATGPRPDTQDFFLEPGDCFDYRMLGRQNPEIWREGLYRQTDFKENGYILGPVIRLRANGSAQSDVYNQRQNLIFSTQHTVFIPGSALLESLYEADPRLREGFAVPRGLPHEHLAAKFDLQPKNTDFQDFWTTQNQ